MTVSKGGGNVVTAVDHLLTEAFDSQDNAVKYILKNPGSIWKWYSEATTDAGLPFVQSFLHAGLGIDPNYEGGKLKGFHRTPSKDWQTSTETFSVDARTGIDELQRIIGFILSTNLVFAGIGTALKLILSERHHERVDVALGSIGDQLGLGWASGMALSQIFEVAAMDQIRELVNVQVHGARLDMMTVRTLARQHHITEDEFWSALDLLGYPDELKRLILQLDTTQLAPPDLQALWGLGRMSRDEIKAYMRHIGYSDTDVDKLLTVWIDHSETSDIQQYRATLRADYLDARIGQDEYMDMLAQLLTTPHTPPIVVGEGHPHYDAAPDQVKQTIDLSVASALFTIEYGRTTTTVAELGKLLKTGHITQGEFRRRVEELGYTARSAAELSTYYQIPPMAGKPGLTSAKILSYAASGTISGDDAYRKLVQLGMDPKDAAFLAYNPSTKAGPWYPPFNVATIKQAWFDGVADNDQAAQSLTKLGLTTEAIKEELTLWHHQKTHSILTTPAQIKQETGWESHYRDSVHRLYMAGGLGDAETINLLEESGLSQSDAGYLWAGWYTALHGSPPGPPGLPSAS